VREGHRFKLWEVLDTVVRGGVEELVIRVIERDVVPPSEPGLFALLVQQLLGTQLHRGQCGIRTRSSAA